MSASPRRPGDKRAAAPAARRRAFKALLQIGNVLQACGVRLRQHHGFDGRHDPLHLIVGEHHLALALDVTDVAVRQNVWWH